MTRRTQARRDGGFVLTPCLEQLVKRALLYLDAGLALHLRGPAGVGKTAMAMHLAGLRDRPVHLIFGNEAYGGFELAGSIVGHRQKLVIDNYVHRVTKRTEEVEALGADGPLLRAVRDGGTLVYDEFTRSRPEANTLLLSILEEGVVEVPTHRRGSRQIRVHPEFRAIFTSNPSEYVGVHRSADALMDRMVTLDLAHRDYQTDVAIVAAAAEISPQAAEVVVRAVRRRLGQNRKGGTYSLRPAIMIGKVLRQGGIMAEARHPAFRQICNDIAGPVPALKEDNDD